MASSIQLLRSTISQERPFPGNLLEGQPAVNLNASEPGLFFKAADGSLVKFGPAAITSDGSPPNSSPQGSSGNTIGELWLDKSTDPAVLKVYDGASWVDAGSGGGGGGGGTSTFLRWIYTAAGGETSLSGSSGGVLLDYTPGLEEVYVNGVLITRGTDYSATNGTSITNLSALTAGDVVTVMSMNPSSTVQLPGQVTLLRWAALATVGQTLLSGTDASGQQLDYTPEYEEVYINGALLRRGSDYTATNGSTITLLSALNEDDEITVMAWTPFTIGSQIVDADVATNAAISSSKLSYTPPFTGTYSRSLSEREVDYDINLLDFIPVQYHDEIRTKRNGYYLTVSYDATAAFQAAIEAAHSLGGGTIFVPPGRYKITSTVYFLYSSIRIVGAGKNSTQIYYENVAGGTGFSSFLNYSTAQLDYTNNCLFSNLTLSRSRGVPTEAAALDPDIWFDFSHFSYSRFSGLNVETTRPNAACFYGQGNNGSTPYYNVFDDIYASGGGPTATAWSQTAFRFRSGLWSGGSDGPNANIFSNMGRCAALAYFLDAQSGNGNLFSNISCEAITNCYFNLNERSAVDSGTSSGTNSSLFLEDSTKSWTSNQYVLHTVKITGGTGAGQIRTIWYNSATQLRIYEPWAVLPDATSTYEIYEGKCVSNHFVNLRGEGSAVFPQGTDMFRLNPGALNNEVKNVEISSLGAGLAVRDNSGSVRNKIIQEDKEFREIVLTPGPNANINIYPRSGTNGGLLLNGVYYPRWLTVNTTTPTLGDTLTVTWDAGGNAVGGGAATMQVIVPDGQQRGTDIAIDAVRGSSRRGGDEPVFLNVQTGPSFSPTASLTITWCVAT